MTRNEKTKNIAVCAVFVALISICSWISVPTAVPFTLQTFAIFLCAGLLGTKRSCMSIVCWILLGIVGIPVFANFQAGPSVIFGPLGGYILGFILTAITVGTVSEKTDKHPAALSIAMIIGLFLCYAVGTAWYIYFYGKSAGPIGISAALSMCVIPFIIPDMIKIAAAVFLTKRLQKFV